LFVVVLVVFFVFVFIIVIIVGVARRHEGEGIGNEQAEVRHIVAPRMWGARRFSLREQLQTNSDHSFDVDVSGRCAAGLAQ
jgi:hypothetical protein